MDNGIVLDVYKLWRSWLLIPFFHRSQIQSSCFK